MSLSLLSRCIILATEAHSGQVDKAGEPYILHPLRVMCDPSLRTEIERCVAVLHDAIEDASHVPIEGVHPLKKFEWLPAEIRWRLDLLNRHSPNKPDGQKYFDYIQQICDSADPICITVKWADIKNNSDPDRLSRMDADSREHCLSLRPRYKKAYHMLLAALPEGEWQ